MGCGGTTASYVAVVVGNINVNKRLNRSVSTLRYRKYRYSGMFLVGLQRLKSSNNRYSVLEGYVVVVLTSGVL